MSLANYSDLTTEVTNWLARDDLTSYYSNWVAIFEAAANRNLRVRQMETQTSLTFSSGSVALPSDFLTWRRLTFNGATKVELEYVHPTVLNNYYPNASSGTPRFFTIEGSSIKISPITNGSSYTFDYYQRIPSLSANSTNWLMNTSPDAYLYGTLAQGYLFQKDPNNAAIYTAQRNNSLDELKRLDQKFRGPSAIRVVGTPIA